MLFIFRTILLGIPFLSPNTSELKGFTYSTLFLSASLFIMWVVQLGFIPHQSDGAKQMMQRSSSTVNNSLISCLES